MAIRRTIQGIFALTALAMSSSAQAADWQSFGPEPIAGGDTGRIISVAAHPSKAEELYVGSASGGVWKKVEGKWIPISNKLPAASIGALAIDPQKPETIYAGSGEPTYSTHAFYGLGMYKSTDAGKTWKVIGKKTFAGRTFGRILVHPKRSETLFAATLRAGTPKKHPMSEGPVGLFRSDDAGKSWSKVPGLPDTMCSDVEFSPDNPDTMYATMASYGSKAGVYKSTDGGKSWKRIGKNKIASTGKFRIAVSKANPKKLWLVTAKSKVFRSDDAGASWNSISVSGLRVQGWYDIDIAADPKDENAAYVAGVNLFRTTNNGARWSRITPPHVDLQVLDFDADGKLLCGGDGGIHRSGNKGSRWEVIGKGISNIQIYAGMSTHPTNENFFIGGLQDNGTVLRDKDSLAWDHVLGGDGGYTAVHPDSPEIVFAEIYGAGALYKSSSGGRSLRKSSSGISSGDRTAFFAPLLFHPKDSGIMYYATQRLYTSTDGGRNWKAISGDVTGGKGAMRSLAISPANPKYMYAETTGDLVVVSSDGGKTFKTSLKDSPGYPRVARALSAAPWGDGKVAFKGVGAFDTDQVIVTKDGGQTWSGHDGDLPNVPVNAVEAFQVEGESAKLVLAASDQGVFLNCDLDGHWRRVGKLLPNVPVHDIRYDKFHKRIVAGTFGRGAWTHPEADAAFFRKLCMETESPDPSQDSQDSEGSASGGGEGSASGGSESDSGKTGGESGGDSGKGKASEENSDQSGKGDGSSDSGKGDGASGDEDGEGSGKKGCSVGSAQGAGELLFLFGLLGWLRRRSS